MCRNVSARRCCHRFTDQFRHGALDKQFSCYRFNNMRKFSVHAKSNKSASIKSHRHDVTKSMQAQYDVFVLSGNMPKLLQFRPLALSKLSLQLYIFNDFFCLSIRQSLTSVNLLRQVVDIFAHSAKVVVLFWRMTPMMVVVLLFMQRNSLRHTCAASLTPPYIDEVAFLRNFYVVPKKHNDAHFSLSREHKLQLCNCVHFSLSLA